jgi:hypothetical protein
MGWRPFRKGDDPRKAVHFPHGPPGSRQLRTLRDGSVAGSPITNELELALRLQELCGATGYRIDHGVILALRYDDAGNEVVIDRFQVCEVHG